MTQSAVDKELVRARKALRAELTKVEQGYFEPNSPWYDVISRLIGTYETRHLRAVHERERKQWTSPDTRTHDCRVPCGTEPGEAEAPRRT